MVLRQAGQLTVSAQIDPAVSQVGDGGAGSLDHHRCGGGPGSVGVKPVRALVTLKQLGVIVGMKDRLRDGVEGLTERAVKEVLGTERTGGLGQRDLA